MSKDDLYHGIAIAGAVIVIVSVLLAIVRLQRERPFSSLSALLAGVGAGGSLAVYMLVLDMALKDGWVIGLLAGGSVLGALAGTKVPLYKRGGIVFSKAAGWHLAPPGLAVAAFQISGVRESPDGVIISLGAVYAASAFAIAASVLLLLRRIARGSGARVAEQPSGAESVAPAEQPATSFAGSGETICPNCGTVSAAGRKFCRVCGERLST